MEKKIIELLEIVKLKVSLLDFFKSLIILEAKPQKVQISKSMGRPHLVATS